MLDDILIHRLFSPLSGWAQHRFGLGQWKLSIECLNGNIAFYLAGIAFSIADKTIGDGIFIDMLKGVCWLLIMDFARGVMQATAPSPSDANRPADQI